MIHKLADVHSSNIGKGTTIWQFSVVLEGAVIGENCNINCHTFVEGGVTIGDSVTVKSGIYLWDGITIEDDVFLGPSVVFTNDLYPRSKQRVEYARTLIKCGASIGANASILAGVTIGRYAMIGMGSVVTKDVPDHALVYGHPATIKGWVDTNGVKLTQIDDRTYRSINDDIYILTTPFKLTKQ